MKPPIAHQNRTETLPLRAALLIYGDRYVTRHDIEQQKSGAPLLGPGRPLTRADLGKLLAAAGRDAGLSGWLDPRVLFVGPETVVWYSDAQWQTMHFQCERDKDVGRLTRRAGSAPQPVLVWAVHAKRWYVWALQLARGRPGPDTPLFQAPYLNVYASGEICTGNAAIPKRVSTEVLARYEQAFFESRFTHPNAPALTLHKDGIYALWNELLDSALSADLATSLTRFPEDTLVPLHKTLGELVHRLTKDPRDEYLPPF